MPRGSEFALFFICDAIIFFPLVSFLVSLSIFLSFNVNLAIMQLDGFMVVWVSMFVVIHVFVDFSSSVMGLDRKLVTRIMASFLKIACFLDSRCLI